MKRSMVLCLAVVVAVAVAGCGESKADKAKKQVCSARSDIQKQVNELKSLTPTTVTADKVKSSLSSIQDDLKKITAAQGDLNAERKKQVQSANQEFSSQLQSIAGSFGSSLSLSQVATQLQSALQQLGTAYQTTFAKVDCS
jgi:hypothetical protein